MNRADAVGFPFLMNQPLFWRIGKIFAERFERSADDEFGRAEKFGAIVRS